MASAGPVREPTPAPAGPPSRAVVVTLAGPRALRSPTVIGRDPARADLVLDDATVSGAHAELREGAGGRWILRDLGSRNGTFVDGVRVADDAPLAGAHQLGFGQARLSFVLERPARLVVAGDAPGGRIERGDGAVELDRDELALVRALAVAGRAALDRSGTSEGFVRLGELAA
ncbi:MAG TPA: FHA domain-containing protein, partial [Kofleriaceae bacterium]|nr:FHA domain-containing protein [Kofleriaceae bacterium]